MEGGGENRARYASQRYYDDRTSTSYRRRVDDGGREAEAERKREAEIKRKKQEDKFQISSINWRIAGATSTANTNTDTCTHGVLRNANGHGGDFNPAWVRAHSFERACDSLERKR